ncbi:hypothetical protein F4777DRAFT_213272 [Nemania sp. FL0916]|nr:hypothetical protein F4777DRAFT_213272 [Nemania sp. FL0916]
MASAATSFTSDGECKAIEEKLDNCATDNVASPPSVRGEETESPSSTEQHGTDYSNTDESESGDDDTIEQAFRVIRDTFHGLPCSNDPTFSFSYGQQSYEKLYSRLAQADLLDFFEDSVRADWNSETGELTLRLMETYLHDIFQDFVIEAIKEEMARIAKKYPSLLPVQKRIISGGHGRIRLSSKQSRAPLHQRSPDGQLLYEGTRTPHFLLEVAYSQTEHSLLTKVNEYFQHLTPLSTILTIDIGYAAPRLRSSHVHHASLSLWASTETEDSIKIKRLVKNAVFRDKDKAVPGELVIPFALLLPPGERSQVPPDAQARFSFESLSNFLKVAEDQQRLSDEGSPPPTTTQKKRIFFDVDDSVIGDSLVPVPEAKRSKIGSSKPADEAQPT